MVYILHVIHKLTVFVDINMVISLRLSRITLSKPPCSQLIIQQNMHACPVLARRERYPIARNRTKRYQNADIHRDTHTHMGARAHTHARTHVLMTSVHNSDLPDLPSKTEQNRIFTRLSYMAPTAAETTSSDNSWCYHIISSDNH